MIIGHFHLPSLDWLPPVSSTSSREGAPPLLDRWRRNPANDNSGREETSQYKVKINSQDLIIVQSLIIRCGLLLRQSMRDRVSVGWAVVTGGRPSNTSHPHAQGVKIK